MTQEPTQTLTPKPTLKQRLDAYEKLMRLDKPIGTLLLLWPALWGLWFASPVYQRVEIVLIFVLGTVLMRSAGCVMNDYADRDIDAHVKRTAGRPLAKKLIDPKEALALAAVLALLALQLCTGIGNVVLPPRRFAWRGSHVALKWSTDGKFIATGTQENDIHVWRIAQATDMRMQGYPAKVKSLSWSADARWLYTSSQPVFTAWSFAGKGPEGKPPLQFGDEGAGLFTVVAAHPAAEFAAGGYDSGELQLGDIKNRRSAVLKLSFSMRAMSSSFRP